MNEQEKPQPTRLGLVHVMGADGLLCAKILADEFAEDIEILCYSMGIEMSLPKGSKYEEIYLCGGGFTVEHAASFAKHTDNLVWFLPNAPDDFSVDGAGIVTHRDASEAACKLLWENFRPSEAAPLLIEIAVDGEMGHYRLPDAMATEASLMSLSHPVARPLFDSEDLLENMVEYGKAEMSSMLIEFLGEIRKPRALFGELGTRYLSASHLTVMQMAWIAAKIVARQDDECAHVLVPTAAIGHAMGAPGLMPGMLAYSAGPRQSWFNRTFSGAALYERTESPDATPADGPAEPTSSGIILGPTGRTIH